MIYYLIIINVIGFFIMNIDKKKAIKKAYRIPEKNLLFICVLGGSLGMLIGMYKFHHKTKHNKFVYGVPSLLIFNIIMIYSMTKML
ncbi:DUF1294 domain-containing protein [Terrisporobacter hibernicus]|uniref:DUF1294 domain-containing protein n=1 Tax=Terrisporobacter hibernicus TaxID=2813371 RepID=A0AAX2ZF44_9FIRM|nr:DUF1294 domain-containing protein [Terrisporobacter hibernicus]UEL47015.1 DUF1294 domain-containing protein [Terrisporobacter hibernicus]UPA29360.1 DUF1294 domain-containing protein [Terrisporobacter glycolicus]